MFEMLDFVAKQKRKLKFEHLLKCMFKEMFKQFNLDDTNMNRFAAASMFNHSSLEGQPSYKQVIELCLWSKINRTFQALLSVLQQQQKPGSNEDWLNAALNPPTSSEE